MTSLLARLNAHIDNIPKGVHTCSDVCIKPNCLIACARNEIERLRSRQTCEGDQPYICHALATARSDCERLRQQLGTPLETERENERLLRENESLREALQNIAEMRVPVIPSRFMDESMAEYARAALGTSADQPNGSEK